MSAYPSNRALIEANYARLEAVNAGLVNALRLIAYWDHRSLKPSVELFAEIARAAITKAEAA